MAALGTSELETQAWTILQRHWGTGAFYQWQEIVPIAASYTNVNVHSSDEVPNIKAGPGRFSLVKEGNCH